jgi:RIO kinase 1
MSEERALLDDIAQKLSKEQLVADVGPPIKSGKEATVYRCRSAASTGAYDLALKLFRSAEHRGFRNDAIYWEGSVALRKANGETRESRALRKHSPFGRRFAAKTWVEHEWEVLNRLWESGLPVPRPMFLVESGMLMELFATDAGDPAPPLHGSPLEHDTAAELFDSLQRDIGDMLRLDLVHGDLSPYNILWNGQDYRLIDFPQSVDARFNPHAHKLLLRDLVTLEGFFRECGVVVDAAAFGEGLWSRYQQSLT